LTKSLKTNPRTSSSRLSVIASLSALEDQPKQEEPVEVLQDRQKKE